MAVFIAVLMFCVGAAFTLLDIGSDLALAMEYYQNSYFIHSPPTLNQTTNGLRRRFSGRFAMLTTIWIALSGMCQVIFVLYFMVCYDKHIGRQMAGHTDRPTDRQTDTRTD